MLKIALVYVPGVWEISLPPIGITYLYSYLQEHGYHAELVDLNIEFLTGVTGTNTVEPVNNAIAVLRTDDFYNLGRLEEYSYYMNLNIGYLEKKMNAIDAPEDEANPVKEFFMSRARQLSTYDIVGLSVIFKEQIPAAQRLAQMLKECNPAVKILVGGTAASFKDFSTCADLIIHGDGEMQLLRYVEAYQKKCQTHESESADSELANLRFCRNLDQLPTPAYSILFNKYQYASPHPVVPLPITRGCYWGKCQFCSYGWIEDGKKTAAQYRKASVEKIIHDIQQLSQENNTRYFYFTVDVTDPLLLEKLSDVLIQQSIHIYWRTEIRAEKNFLKPGLLEKLYQAGCRLVSFGMESVVQRVLDQMNKGVYAENSKQLIQRLYQVGIGINTDFFIGYPSETPEEAAITQGLVADNNHKLLSFSPGGVFIPFARSPVVRSSQLKFIPSENRWLKDGMSFDQQVRQQQICNANMIFNTGIVRFPFRNDAIYYFLYCCRYTVPQIVDLIKNNQTLLRIFRQTLETFAWSLTLFRQMGGSLDFESLQSDDDPLVKETLNSKNPLNKKEMLDLHYHLLKTILRRPRLGKEKEEVLLELAEANYYLLLSCFNEEKSGLPFVFSVSPGPDIRLPADWRSIRLKRRNSGMPIYSKIHGIDIERLMQSDFHLPMDRQKKIVLYDVNGIHFFNGDAPPELMTVLLEKIVLHETESSLSFQKIMDREFPGYSLTQINQCIHWLLSEGLIVMEKVVPLKMEDDILRILNQLESGKLSIGDAEALLH